MPTPNYSYVEYLVLIDAATCKGDLELINELMQEDRKGRCIDPFDYIDLKCNWVLKLAALTIEGYENMTE